MEDSVDCAKSPELCVPGGPRLEEISRRTFHPRAQENLDEGDSQATLVTVISILSVGLVLGLAALAFFWKKSNKEQTMRMDIEKERLQGGQGEGGGPTNFHPQKAFAVPGQSRRNGEPAPPRKGALAVRAENREKLAAQPPLIRQQSIQTAQNIPTPMTLARTDDVQFTNEGDAFEDNSGSVQQLTDAQAESDRRANRAQQGGLKFKYRNMGGFQDVGNVHPKNDYKKDESNQCLWDIVMVRLSLINEDFVHKSRYTSGQPFGFKHDVLIANNAFDDEWEQEEVDSYESGR